YWISSLSQSTTTGIAAPSLSGGNAAPWSGMRSTTPRASREINWPSGARNNCDVLQASSSPWIDHRGQQSLGRGLRRFASGNASAASAAPISRRHRQPTLVANGVADAMVAIRNSYWLADHGMSNRRSGSLGEISTGGTGVRDAGCADVAQEGRLATLSVLC